MKKPIEKGTAKRVDKTKIKSKSPKRDEWKPNQLKTSGADKQDVHMAAKLIN